MHFLKKGIQEVNLALKCSSKTEPNYVKFAYLANIDAL